MKLKSRSAGKDPKGSDTRVGVSSSSSVPPTVIVTTVPTEAGVTSGSEPVTEPPKVAESGSSDLVVTISNVYDSTLGSQLKSGVTVGTVASDPVQLDVSLDRGGDFVSLNSSNDSLSGENVPSGDFL